MKHFSPFETNTELQTIAQAISEQGGRAFLVGGCVRDAILGLDSKDIDVEVFQMKQETLLKLLSAFGKVDAVGESFSVIKLTTETQDFDFSLPRVETKTGVGHTGFVVQGNPNLSFETAASRRDFTINALMFDIVSKELFDFFGGLSDIENKILRHCSPAFAEDPLRVLRAMQFAARFGFELSEETIVLCKELRSEFDAISKERLWTEFEKLFSKGKMISKGLQVLFETEWIECFPSLIHLLDKNEDVLLRFNLDSINPNSTQRVLFGLSFLLEAATIENRKTFLEQINASNETTREVLELLKISEEFFEFFGLGVSFEASARLALGQHKKFVSKQTVANFIGGCEGESILDILDADLQPRITGEVLISFGWSPKEHKKLFGEELKRLFGIQLLQNKDFEDLLLEIKKPDM